MQPELPDNKIENRINVPEPKHVFPVWTIIFGTVALLVIVLYAIGVNALERSASTPILASRASENVPTISIPWGNLGAKLVTTGVIDRVKFESLYSGTLAEETRALLDGAHAKNLVITRESAGLALNLLWALGLANKSVILERGPMADPQYGGAGRFASTGGWTIAAGNAMNHYSRHEFVKLTLDQQTLVSHVAQNIHRPCCDNPTYFPDCNHGMAMLGLLELLAARGTAEDELYRTALAVNSLWFPDTYENIKAYVESNGTSWDTVDPKYVLGREYSSGSGYQNMVNRMTNPTVPRGGSCAV